MSPVTLTLKKLAFGAAATRELFEGSNAEALLSNVLAQDLSLGIETLLFDAVAADTTRPAGLKNGISAITADAGSGIDAMFNDLGNLAAAVSAVGGTNFCFIASVKQAIKINLRKSQNSFPYPVYATSGLPDKQVACLALDALAVAGSSDPPRVEFSRQATLHMEDATPTDLTTGGSFASPVRSLFQSDSIGMRIILDLSWALRSLTGFAYTTVNW